jgi:hypothetical protein
VETIAQKRGTPSLNMLLEETAEPVQIRGVDLAPELHFDGRHGAAGAFRYEVDLLEGGRRGGTRCSKASWVERAGAAMLRLAIP